jgi:hypothetical protein
MSKCSLIVDDRELAVSPFLGRNNVPYTISRITTGDFAIIYSNNGVSRILAVFERKTLADLAQSITGSRYESQIANMVEMQKKYPGCQIYYIIEGRAFPAEDDTFSRTPYSTLASAISKLEIVYGVQTIKTKDSADTAAALARKVRGFDHYWSEIADRHIKAEPNFEMPEWSFELMYILKTILQYPDSTNEQIEEMCGDVYRSAKQSDNFDLYTELIRKKNVEMLEKLEIVSTEWAKIVGDDTSGSNDIKGALTETKHKSNDDIKIQMWMSLAGVSNLTAPSLNNKLSLLTFIKGEILPETLIVVKYPSGKSLHKNLIDLITAGPDEKTELKMLKCIPGMGAKADVLLTGRRLRELAALTPGELATIKIGRNNLGPVKAGEILGIFK